MRQAEILTASNPQDTARWKDLVSDSADSDVYYLPEYACATAEIERTEPVTLVAGLDCSRILAPLLVRRVCSTAGESQLEWVDAATPYGYGGMLRVSSSSIGGIPDLSGFFEQLRELCLSRAIVCCVLRLHPLAEQESWFASPELERDCIQVHHGGLTCSLHLQAWDEELDQPRNMRHGRGADLRRANRELHTSWTGGDDAAVETSLGIFRILYQESLSRQRADDFYNFRSQYFSQLTRLGSQMGIAIAWRGEMPVAATLFLAGRRFAHYHLAGMNEQGRKYGASTMLIVEGARWARLRGCQLLHLGGGVSPGDSLEDYKRSFGGPSHRYAHVTYVADRKRFEEICALPNAPWPYNVRASSPAALKAGRL